MRHAEPDDVGMSAEAFVPTIWSAVFDDATVEDRLRFFRITFRVLVAIHIAWACGLLYAPFGLTGFAWAEDVKDFKERIKVEVGASQTELLKPINKRLDDLSLKVEETLGIQRKVLAGQLASQLRDLNRIRCRTRDDVTRWRVEADMEEAQLSYRALTSERYPISACKDL